MKRVTGLLMLIILLSSFTSLVSAEELTEAEQYISDGLFGSDEEVEEDDEENRITWPISTMVEGFNSIIGGIATGFIQFLGLKDPGELIFHNSTAIGDALGDKDTVYNTFTKSTWRVIEVFYGVVKGSVGYMLLVALVVWGLILVFRSDTAIGQYSIREMIRGFVTFFVLMIGMSYFIELFFDVNKLIVNWSKEVVSAFSGTQGITLSVDNVNFITVIMNAITSKILEPDLATMLFAHIGLIIIILALVIVIGLINYQYAVRMVAIGILIIIYPIVAFASIFPARQKAFDMWAREFASQVFMNAAHAIIWAFFLLLLYNKASFWILIPMLFSLPTLTSLIRIMFGAQMTVGGVGGAIGGAMGFAAIKGIASIMRGARGGSPSAGSAGGKGNVIKGTGKDAAQQSVKGARSVGNMAQTKKPGLKQSVTRGVRGAKNIARDVGKAGVIGAAGAGVTLATAAATGNAFAAEGAGIAAARLAGEGLKVPERHDALDGAGEDHSQGDFAQQYHALTNEHKGELQQLFPNTNFQALTKKPNPMASKLAREVSNLAPSQQTEIQKLLPRVQFEGRSPNLAASQLASEFMNATPDIQKQVAQMMPAMRDFQQLPDQTQSRMTNDLMQTDNSYNEAVESIKEQYQSMPAEQQARAVELMPVLKDLDEKPHVFEEISSESEDSSFKPAQQPQYVEPPIVDPPSFSDKS